MVGTATSRSWKKRVHQVLQEAARGLRIGAQGGPVVIGVELLAQPDEGPHDLRLLGAVEHAGDLGDQRIGLGDCLAHGGRLIGVDRIVDRAHQRPDLVEERGRLVEELAQVDGVHVAPGQAEDVVHPLGGLAVVQLLGDVLRDLVLELRHVVVEGVRRRVADHLREDRDRIGLEVDLLEVAVGRLRHDLKAVTSPASPAAPPRVPAVTTPPAPRLTRSIASPGSRISSTGTGFEPARIPVAAETTLRTVLPAPQPADRRLPSAAPDVSVDTPAALGLRGPHFLGSPRRLVVAPLALNGDGPLLRGLQIFDFAPAPRSGFLTLSPVKAPDAPSTGASTDRPAPATPTAPSSPTGVGAAGSGGAAGFGTALLAVLLALSSMAAQRFTRITLPPANARPAAFVWLLERPG